MTSTDILKPILVNIVNNVFKTKSISSLNGISGSFIYKYAYENKTYNHIILLLDIGNLSNSFFSIALASGT